MSGRLVNQYTYIVQRSSWSENNDTTDKISRGLYLNGVGHLWKYLEPNRSTPLKILQKYSKRFILHFEKVQIKFYGFIKYKI